MSIQVAEKHTFEAEVKQVLDIVVHSLYTEKEIFVRELVSNASDALEKLRYKQLTEKNIFQDTLPFEINITTNKTTSELTFQDYGIGMTLEELKKNLGTIAHSGSKKFLKAIKEKNTSNKNLIGQFGVGFYSLFMVASSVRVLTRSWQINEKSFCWFSDGSGEYTINSAENNERGCKIILKIKDQYKEFIEEERIKVILNKYSNFVQFPIRLNGKIINTINALWACNRNEIKNSDYQEFYKFQSNSYEEAMDWMHFNADAPLEIKALIFIPKDNTERHGFGKLEPNVSLYCRKILIDSKPKYLLPEWLRFLHGVVDSSDLPLNISRESMQDSALMQKLNKVITTRLLKKLEEIIKKDFIKYKTFWTIFGSYLKEGVISDFIHRDRISKLLLFESSKIEANNFTSFSDYINRMKSDQKEIYFLSGSNRSSIEKSPYLEAFKNRNIEVLYLYQPIDEYVMNHLSEYDKKKLISIDQDDINLEINSETINDKRIPDKEIESLCSWMQEILGKNRVSKVIASKRLINSPAIALNNEKKMTNSMRHLMNSLNANKTLTPPLVTLEINSKHPIIHNLTTLRSSNISLAKIITEQLLDNTLIATGLLEDSKLILDRLNKILEKVSEN